MDSEKLETSVHKATYEIFRQNPMLLFSTSDLANILNSKYSVCITKNKITMILTRLFRNNLILRSPSQMTTGFLYSLDNKQLLGRIYRNYLVPYEVESKSNLIPQLCISNFEHLDNHKAFPLTSIAQNQFVKRYPLELFKTTEAQAFFALLAGFAMCDGNINKNLTRTCFFFRRKDDAEKFVRDFVSAFKYERFKVYKANNGDSYTAQLLGGAHFSKLLHKLGAPRGNKVFQPFCVPGWIYQGSEEVKKAFISTVIGNEGSAPSKRRWRIQFVLSKAKDHIPNLIHFLNQIRALLYNHGIKTSYIQLRKQEGRQYHGRFYIQGEENIHKFYKQFSFLYASEKQEVLRELILRSEKRNDQVNTI